MSIYFLSFVAAAVIVAISIESSSANRGKCQIKMLSMKNNSNDTLFFMFQKVKITFQYESSCSPRVFYGRQYDNKTISLNSPEIRKTQGLHFTLDYPHLKGNMYETSFTIKFFNREYMGDYEMIIMDASDQDNNVSVPFSLEGKLSDGRKTDLEGLHIAYPPCFLPHATNIIATSHPASTGSSMLSSITLQWQVTSKENPDIKYCNGSRRWKVRLLKFSNLDDIPGDYEVVSPPSDAGDWNTVPGRSTTFNFTQGDLSTSYFYSFQVEHLGKNFNADTSPKTFASQVHYFGKQQPVAINKLSAADSIIRIQVGLSRSVSCEATGFPKPSMIWIRQDSSTPTVRQNNSAILELRHVTYEDAGTYFCIANNILVNPPKGRRGETDSWAVTVIVEDYDESGTGLSCRSISMESSVCKNYIHTSLRIFTDKSTNESEQEREERANSLMSTTDFFIGLGTCRNLAYSMICHSVYPYCDVIPSKPTPRKLCKSVCDEFLSGRCKDHHLTEADEPLYSIIVTGCDSRQHTAGESPECIPLSYNTYRTDQVEFIEDTGDCVRNDGRGYSGHQYLTESGSLCQLWSLQSPHPHPMLPDIYRSDLEQAHLSCRNPGGIGNRPWCYTNNPDKRWEYCDIPKCDSCELYTGETCRNVEGYSNGTTVTITRSKILQTQKSIERKISDFLKSILLQQQPSEGCEEILQVLICQGAFPHCSSESSTKQLCSAYCTLNQTLHHLCPSIYEEFAEFVTENNFFMSKANCELDNPNQCIQLPAATLDGFPEGGKDDKLQDDCYVGTGRDYNGTVSVTEKGVSCQYWDSPEPHSHTITSERYSELYESKNYCRNPGNLKERPWCFTTDPETVWDYCDIQKCESFDNESPRHPSHPGNSEKTVLDPNAQSSSGAIVVAMSILMVILLVLVIVAFGGCILFLRRKNRTAKAILESEFRLSKMTCEAFKGEKYVTNVDYTQVSTAAKNKSQSLVIPENFKLLDNKDIKYVSQLGQGNFGIVFKGKAFGLKEEVAEEDEGIDVAVKTLKEEASSEVKQDFIDEAKLMFTFDHPNILKIHGVCMSEMPYQLVFEYMDEGDLTKFLRSRASSQQRRLINPFSYRSRTESCYSDDPASLSKTELLYICKQIAAGMTYLSDNKHVHRDLACRNCLIKSDLVVKIGDFGMSQNLYSKDYYRISGKAVLPVRWMSPEALIYGKFSVEGDVWSFGVVMWEVFSFALQPYYGITNEEVTEAIRKGKTLNRPDDCPIELYRLMKECWSMDPADRISFSELYDSLSALHQLASLCGSSVGEKLTDDEDDTFSDTSDMPSDAFYSEEHLDDISNSELQDDV